MTRDPDFEHPSAGAAPGPDDLPGLPKLERGLTEVYRPRIDVPAGVDAAVRARIRARFADRDRRRVAPRRPVRWWAGAAAAAALLIAAVWIFGDRSAGPRPPVATSDRALADLDANGRVDILDAFALARRLEAGGVLEADLDVNRDGAVDRRDVDFVAMMAVAVGALAGSGETGS